MHLRTILATLQQHHLYAKMSKCTKCKFGCKEVEYLGHFILENGVKANPATIESMLSWPILTTLNSLKGFLRLIGYYKKCIKGYGLIDALLIALLKKNSFKWNQTATNEF